MNKISTPLVSKSGEKLAVFAARIDLDRMDETLFGLVGPGRTGEVYLLDGNGRFLSSRRLSGGRSLDGFLPAGKLAAASAGGEGFGLYENYRQQPVIGVYERLVEFNLAVLAEIPQEEAFAPARSLAWNLFFVAMGIAAVIMGAGIVMARRITYPVLMIRDAAAHVASGDLDIEKSPSMGLQLVSVLVEQLHGKLTIDSTKGTAFRIELEEYQEAGTRMY